MLFFFAGNSVSELCFRLASVFLGCVPVTVNWDADTPERVLYKLRATRAKLVLHEPDTDAAKRAFLRERAPDVPHLDAAAAVVVLSPSASRKSPADVNAGASSSSSSSSPTLPSIPADATPAAIDSPRIVIFTSGTTGNPKGVYLTYENYVCNQATFEQFLQIRDAESRVSAVVVNPMHHTNSTSFTDWMLRRPRGQLHLFQRYTTPYWHILSQLGSARARASPGTFVIAPAVSRHFDFLESLVDDNNSSNKTTRLLMPMDEPALRAGLHHVDFLLGSAPVGPSTVARLQRFTGKLPLVRFGSTETCLQVMGTPRRLSEEDRLASFQRGWAHVDKVTGEAQPGYFIGQQHEGLTEVLVVGSVEIGAASFMVPCEEGVPGYIVTRGGNIMQGYVGNAEATARALVQVPGLEADAAGGGVAAAAAAAAAGGGGGPNNTKGGGVKGRAPRPWYLNLGDVGFWMQNPADGNKDVFWMSRESALLIRGGSNYAYEQINAELTSFLEERFGVDPATIKLAVVGLKLQSEHEDDCCVTIEVLDAAAAAGPSWLSDLEALGADFIAQACAKQGGVSKGARPAHVRFAEVPRNFKGDIGERAEKGLGEGNGGQVTRRYKKQEVIRSSKK